MIMVNKQGVNSDKLKAILRKTIKTETNLITEYGTFIFRLSCVNKDIKCVSIHFVFLLTKARNGCSVGMLLVPILEVAPCLE